MCFPELGPAGVESAAAPQPLWNQTFKAVSKQPGAHSDWLPELSIFSSLLCRRASLCVRG